MRWMQVDLEMLWYGELWAVSLDNGGATAANTMAARSAAFARINSARACV